MYSVHVVVAGRPSFDSALFELAPDEHRDLGTLRLPRVGTLHALLARSDDGPLDGVAVEVTASADGVALAEGSLPAFAERRPEWRVCLAPGAYRLEVVAGRDVLGVASFEIPSEPRAGDLELTVR
jgi:hypothetical protein